MRQKPQAPYLLLGSLLNNRRTPKTINVNPASLAGTPSTFIKIPSYISPLKSATDPKKHINPATAYFAIHFSARMTLLMDYLLKSVEKQGAEVEKQDSGFGY
jgi:hypothetical protein